MALDRQETIINGGRYAPTVAFNQPARMPLPVQELPKQELPNLNIDLSGLANLFSSFTETKDNSQMYLNEYALELNDIVEGQRTGAYSGDVAERLIRQATDKRLSMGIPAKDLASIRDSYSGGLTNMEEARQKKFMEHETNRRTSQADTFRNTYNYATNWSDGKVFSVIDDLERTQADVEFYSQRMQDPNLTNEDIEMLRLQRGNSYKDLAKVNMSLMMENIINSPEFKPEQITADTVNSIKNTVIANAQANGISYKDAVVLADRAADETGLTTLLSAKSRDIVNSTDFLKKTMAKTDATIGTALRSTTESAIVMNLPDEYLKQMSAYNSDLVKRAANQIFRIDRETTEDYRTRSIPVLMGERLPEDYKESMNLGFQIYKSNVADESYPLSLLTKQGMVASYQFANVMPTTANKSDTDLITMQQNADNALSVLDNPVANYKRQQALQSNDPDTRAAAEVAEHNIETIKGQKAAAALSMSDRNSARTFKTLTTSLQADRLRIDPDTGLLAMVEDTKGIMQTTGDFLGYEGTRQEINSMNAYLEKLSPTARKSALKWMSNDSIKELQTGEATVDLSKQTLGGKIKEGVATASNKTLTAIEDLMRSEEETPKGFGDNVLKAAGNLRQAAELDEYATRLEESVDSAKRTGAKTEAGKLDRDLQLAQRAKQKANELRQQTIEEEEEEIVEDSDGADVDMLNAYRRDQERVTIPSKEDVKVPELPGAIDMRIRELQQLKQMKQAMDDYPQEFDSRKYQQLTTRIAQIEKVLEE